jgi:hypothetical protein
MADQDPDAVPKFSSLARFWLPSFVTEITDPCATIGSTIYARFTTQEYGVGEGTFTWLGEDLTFDVNFP